MKSYMIEMINERRSSSHKVERRDLLSNLVDANEEFSGDGEQRLSKEELVGMCLAGDLPAFRLKKSNSGNIFVIYLAGYEVRTFQSAAMTCRSDR